MLLCGHFCQEVHGRVFLVPCKVTCTAYALVHFQLYTGQVTYYKVPEKTMAMINWSLCSLLVAVHVYTQQVTLYKVPEKTWPCITGHTVGGKGFFSHLNFFFIDILIQLKKAIKTHNGERRKYPQRKEKQERSSFIGAEIMEQHLPHKDEEEKYCLRILVRSSQYSSWSSLFSITFW